MFDRKPELLKEEYIRYGIPDIEEYLPELFEPKNTEEKPFIAVADNGIRHDNGLFEIYKNPKEIVDGKDSDNNGYIDDTEGFNFSQKNNNMDYTGGHAGNVARVLTECNPNIIRLLDIIIKERSNPSHWDAIEGLLYAAKMKATAVNFSYVTNSNTMFKYVAQKLQENDCILLAPTGKGSKSLSEDYTYPASIIASRKDQDPSKPLLFHNIIVTAAITLDHKIVAQWDSEQVLVLGYSGAPSFAAPIPGNLIAMMKYLEPSLNSEELVDLVCGGAIQYTELDGKSKHGVINYKKSIEILLGKKLETVISPPIIVEPKPEPEPLPQPIEDEPIVHGMPEPNPPVVSRSIKKIKFKYNDNSEKTFTLPEK